MTKAKIYREKKREIDVPTSTCRCDLSWHFFKQRESTTFDIRKSSAGLLAWNFYNIFTCPNSQDKNLHIQNILVIFEYVWAKILYHYSKSFKHLERDSMFFDVLNCTKVYPCAWNSTNLRTYHFFWCIPGIPGMFTSFPVHKCQLWSISNLLVQKSRSSATWELIELVSYHNAPPLIIMMMSCRRNKRRGVDLDKGC